MDAAPLFRRRGMAAAFLAAFAAAGAGCTSGGVPKDALLLKQESLALRQQQSRRFATADEKSLVVAAAGLLQDLGFSLDESEVSLGVIVGSKTRSATDTGQIIGSFFAALLGAQVPYDQEQKIRASLVTRPSDTHPGETLLRVTFQRIVWNNMGDVWKLETISDDAVYVEFFDKLSKAVFLEANEI